MSLLLSQEELRELTGRVQPRAQCKSLDRLGIPYKVDPMDRRPRVLRAQVVAALGGEIADNDDEFEPDWSLLHRKR